MTIKTTTTKRQTAHCNFCDASEHEVRALIRGPESDVMICNKCVWLCVEIIAEREVDARKART